MCRARKEAKAPRLRCARRGPAAAARPADRHQGSRGDQDPLTTYGSPSIATSCRAGTPSWSAACAAGAVVVGKTNVPEFGAGITAAIRGAPPATRSTRGSIPAARRRPAVALATGMPPVVPDRTPAARCASPRCGVVGFVRRPAWSRSSVAAWADADLGAGADGPHRRRHLPALRHADRPARHRPAVLPVDGQAFAEPWPVGQPVGRLTGGFRRHAGRGHPRHDARQDQGDEAPVPPGRQGRHGFRRADRRST